MYNETDVETSAGVAKPIGNVETGMLGLLGAAQTLQSRLESALESVGLSIPKYLALQRLLGAGEPVSLSALAEQQRCGRSNITQLIDRLETDGLVERVSDPADRRAVRASVTSQGIERFKAGTEAINEVQTQLASRVAPEDRETFLRVLEAIRQP